MAYSKKPKKTADTKAVAETEAVEQQPVSEAPVAANGMTAAQMEVRLAELENLIDQVDTESAEDDGMVTRFGVSIKEGTVLRDPFSSQNPVAFKAHPEGMRLSWCNPRLREQIGWKGWKPVTYDSDIGKRIAEYCTDPPARLEGVIQQDNYVRRGKTSILCALPIEVWLYRQMETEAKSERRMNSVMSDKTDLRQPDGSVVIAGEGLVEADRPHGGFRLKHEQGDRRVFSTDHKVSASDKGKQEIADLIPAKDEKAANKALHN